MTTFQKSWTYGMVLAFSLGAMMGPLRAELTEAKAAFPPEYEPLLVKYVTQKGVRYAAWHDNADDRRAMDKVIRFYQTTTPPSSSRNEALAWYLNAYNASVIQLLLERYPTPSPMADGGRFFRENAVIISGEKMSLDDLEKRFIRRGFKEPRIHFALNCGSKSCPPLKPRPFSGATLDEALTDLAAKFVKEQSPVIMNEKGQTKVQLSRIFEWYSDDFGGKDKALDFVRQHRDQTLPEGTEVQYKDYDWSLNESE